MKLTFFSILLFIVNHSFGQSNLKDTIFGIALNYNDTCLKIAEAAKNNLVVKSRHSEPLIIANGIVISGKKLSSDTTLIKSIKVKKCPEAFNEFGYIAFNGAIIIETKQKFKTTTPNIIRLQQFDEIKDSVIFALNGDLLTNKDLKISLNAIKEIELLEKGTQKGTNEKLTNFDCISIWTLKKSERIKFSGLCRGVLITNPKTE